MTDSIRFKLRAAGSIAVLAALLAAQAASAHELKPLSASYTVTRDGKPVGDATYTLAPNGNGMWTLTSVTHGTSGMARMLGLDVREESTFRWNNGAIQGVSYDYKQEAAIKHKERHMDLDEATHQAHVRDGKQSFDFAVPPGTMDRSSVALVLGAGLLHGVRDVTLPVAVKDHVEQQHFVAAATDQAIEVPAGNFKAVLFERVDVPNKARSWYATSYGMLPLRVEQTSGDNSTVVLELKK